MVLRPDNPRVMAHCFPDLTPRRSPVSSTSPDLRECSSCLWVHYQAGIRAQSLIHSVLLSCETALGPEINWSPPSFPFNLQNHWPQARGQLSRAAFLWLMCHFPGRRQSSQCRSVQSGFRAGPVALDASMTFCYAVSLCVCEYNSSSVNVSTLISSNAALQFVQMLCLTWLSIYTIYTRLTNNR